MNRITGWILLGVAYGFMARGAQAADGAWTNDASGNWSVADNWEPAAVPGTGAGDVVSLTNDITAARTITLDTPATVGALYLGDPASSFFSFTLSGGSILTFDNSGSGAVLAKSSAATATDTLAVPVTLADNLNITAGNSILMSSNVTAGSGAVTVTNNGSGGTVTLSGQLASSPGGTLSFVQDSATSVLSLSPNSPSIPNTFTGAVVVRSGTLRATRTGTVDGNYGTSLGAAANVVTLGVVGGGDATLEVGYRTSLNNPVNVVGTGNRTIRLTHSNAGQIHSLGGAITLNGNDLVLQVTAASGVRVSGGITGTGNIIVNNTNAGGNGVDFRTIAVNHVGGITNISSGVGGVSQGSAVSFGTNVTDLTQNSPTSPWLINQANGSFRGTVHALAGRVSVQNASGLNASNAVYVGVNATVDVLNVSLTIAGLDDVSGAGGLVTNSTASAARTLTLGGSGTHAFSGVIANGATGNVALVKSGTGTQTLSGANTYAGPTTVQGGTLKLSADNNLGTAPGSATAGQLVITGGTLAVTAGFTLDANRGLALGPASGTGTGTIDVAAGHTLAYGGIIANNGGAGGLNKSGGGELALSGLNTFSGPAIVSEGTLTLGSGGALASTTITVRAGATFAPVDDFTNSARQLNIEIAGASSHGRVVEGATAYLGGGLSVTLNAYSPSVGNAFTIMTFAARSGTFSTTNLPSLGGGNVWVVDYLADRVVLAVAGLATENTYWWDSDGLAPIGGSGNWDAATALWHNPDSTDPATVWPNIATTNLTAVFAGSAGVVSVVDPINAHELYFGTDGYTVTNGSITLAGDSASKITLSTGITATVASTLTGTNGLLVSGEKSTVVLSGPNDFTGGTTISGGTLKLGAGDALGLTNASLTIGATGVLDLNGYPVGVGAFSAVSGAVITNSSVTTATITMGYANGNCSGVNGNSVFKGNLILKYVSFYNNGSSSVHSDFGTAANEHTGGTIFTGNNLNDRIQNGLALGSGPITLGGEFGPGGFLVPSTSPSNWGSLSNNVTIVGAGNKLALQGASAGTTFTFNQNSVWTGTGSLRIENGFKPTLNLGGVMTNFQGSLVISNNSSDANNSYNLSNGLQIGLPLAALTLNVGGTNGMRFQYTGGGSVDVPVGDLNTEGTSVDSDSILVRNGTAATMATFVIGGLNASSVFNGSLVDGAGTTAIRKVGSGVWTLGGTNNMFTGPTSVSEGALIASNGLPNTASLLIEGGATFGGAGTVGGAVTMSAGATIDLRDGQGKALSLPSGLAVGSGSAFHFDLAAVPDSVNAGGLFSMASTATIYVTNLEALADGFYPLITGAPGISAGSFTLGSTWPGYNLSLVDDASSTLFLEVTAIVATGYDAFIQQITNGLTAYQDDADGDGYANLLEYATGGSPTNADAVALMGGSRTGEVLQLKFTRNPDATDITLIVEGSSGVMNTSVWTGVATNVGGGAWSGSVVETNTSPIYVTADDTGTGPQRNLRLKVTRP